ncbi:MAG: glycosyltransferase family 4 protein [Parcubacteria group bacterium]
MRILVIAPTPFFSDRGAHIRILEESLALEKLGHQITIATYHIGKDIQNDVDTKIDIRRIRRLLFWYKKLEAGPDWQKVLLDIMLIRKVFNLARTQRPDIIHAHLHEGVLIGWIVQKALFWRKIKLVSDFQGSLTGEMVSHGYLKNGLNSIFLVIEKIIDRMGDWAIASSWEGIKNIKKLSGKIGIDVVLDGINLESFKVEKTKDEIRCELELPKDKFIVVYTGGLVANKGINYLLEAIKPVLERRPDVFFLIGGYPKQSVKSFIEKNKLENSVRLVSPLDYFRLPEFLLACDIAIDPKNAEAMQASGKMLNYMAAGLPVVCLDKENNRKYLGNGAYFCPELSAQNIAEGILFFVNRPYEIKEKGEANKQKANEFSWDKPAKIIDGIYKKIL